VTLPVALFHKMALKYYGEYEEDTKPMPDLPEPVEEDGIWKLPGGPRDMKVERGPDPLQWKPRGAAARAEDSD
jgi:hypothetical protein